MNTEGRERCAVAEIQGLYGPFSFPEKLLQQIWLRGDFDGAGAVTNDGRPVQVLHPGRWNLLGGPDFKGARVRLGGVPCSGDVEVHLRAPDWHAHGHSGDAAYADVVLHVVLFPTDEPVTRGVAGREIPVLVLLPLLNHDLEEYAADDAIERLANHPLARAHQELASLSPEALSAELGRQAAARWRQKVRFAALRVQRLGWEAACHHAALEILGYRFNRAPMLSVAGAFPLSAWRADPAATADAALRHAEGRWCRQGVRPANQPRTRLRQYQEWVRRCPDWPERLAGMGGKPPFPVGRTEGAVAEVRKESKLAELQERIRVELCGESLAGPRLDTLICDGFLPLLAAGRGGEAARVAEGVGVFWSAWFAGDNPENFVRLLRELGTVRPPANPLSHGVVQGLLGWLIAHEQRENFPCEADAPGGGA